MNLPNGNVSPAVQHTQNFLVVGGEGDAGVREWWCGGGHTTRSACCGGQRHGCRGGACLGRRLRKRESSHVHVVVVVVVTTYAGLVRTYRFVVRHELEHLLYGARGQRPHVDERTVLVCRVPLLV